MTERIKNTANEYIGSAKQTLGEKTGNQEMASSGAAQKTHAEAAEQARNAERQAAGLGHKIQGRAQETVGNVTNDPEMKARGQTNETLGNFQQRT